MVKGKPKVKVDRRAIEKGLEKTPRPEHANFTFRFDKKLFDEFRKKATEGKKFSATQVLEALMKSYLGR
jgi:hypothetical protein